MVARRMALLATPNSCKIFFTLLDTSPALVKSPPLIGKVSLKQGSAPINRATPFLSLGTSRKPALVEAAAGFIHRQVREHYGNLFFHRQSNGFPVRLLTPAEDHGLDVSHLCGPDNLKVGP